MNPQTLWNLIDLIVTCGVIVMLYFVLETLKAVSGHQTSLGELVSNFSKMQRLKDKYFDLQAREMQHFIERFLGKDFNVDCKFMLDQQPNSSECYHLWIWKRYETREMGCMINASCIPDAIGSFMEMYYSSSYFTDATAFPKN